MRFTERRRVISHLFGNVSLRPGQFFLDRSLRSRRPGEPARRGSARARTATGYRRLVIDPLEQRQLMAVTPVETYYQDLVSVEVVGRHLFYNHSAFDGNDAAVNASDDLAIATDKVALLPGGTASFANYSSYSRGINGVMVDIAGLPSNTLTADDFTFRTGNTNSPTGWTTPPTPSITVRLGAGDGGSARVELVWADGAITGQWLEVTVKASPGTGLAAPDIFYFGNAIGDSGNSPANAIVDAVDVQGAVDNPRTAGNPAPVTFAWDYNRDKLVDAADQALANNNQTNVNTALNLVAPPTVDTSPEYQRPPIALYNWGDGDYVTQYSPMMVKTSSGTILAFTDVRATSQDASGYAIVVRRSTDNGVTFAPPTPVYAVAPSSGVRINGGSVVVDNTTGTIMYTFMRNVSDALIVRSTDDGLTWSTPEDITSSVKVTAGNNPGPPGMYPDTPWQWLAFGPGHGIQLQHGPHAGRIIITADHRETADNSGPSWSHVMYSDDHGVTWHLGGGLAYDDNGPSPNDYSNENTVVELSNGNLFMSIRIVNDNVHNRGESISTDGGITWSTMQLTPELTSTSVSGSLLRLNDNVILFSSPSNPNDATRREMTIWLSYDDAQTWTQKRIVSFGYSAYSDMVVVGPDTILLAYNRGRTGGSYIAGAPSFPRFLTETALARVNLRWLESDDPYQFTYYFNEGAPGQASNSSGTSVQDYGPWDQRARAYAFSDTTSAKYVAGPNGDSALQFGAGEDELILSQSDINAFQFDVNDSFTIELTMKTTDANGVIIGTRPGIKGYALQVVSGKLQFSITDLTNSPTMTSTANINDGNWHRIVAVRDATTKTMAIYVDGVAAATTISDTTSIARTAADPLDAVIMGAFNNLSDQSQLVFAIDTLRITRAALAPSEFLAANAPSIQPYPAPSYPSNSPTSIPGLQLWMPAYDPTRYFADWATFSDPLPLTPFDGMSTRAMMDLSGFNRKIATVSDLRSLQYHPDATLGNYWQFTANANATSGTELKVQSSSSFYPDNFDFVQNTGVFTLSAFVKVTAETGGYMTLFDTNEGNSALPGFTLMRQQSGRLFLIVSGGTGQPVRFSELATGGDIALGQWMHVAVVGSGAGNAIKYYVTPVGADQVVSYTSTSLLTGADGTYSTNFSHDLVIGGRSGSVTGSAPWNGGMVNQAIYNTALTQAQIQQLFQYGKGLTAAEFPWQNPDNPLDVDGNGLIQNVDLLQVINRLIALGITDLSPPSDGNTPPPFIDTSGNNRLEPLDALRIINYLIANPPGGSGNAQTAALATSQATETANEVSFATVTATPAAAVEESKSAAASNIVFALPSSLAANTGALSSGADLTSAPETQSAAANTATPAAPTATIVAARATYAAPKRISAVNDLAWSDDFAIDSLAIDSLELVFDDLSLRSALD